MAWSVVVAIGVASERSAFDWDQLNQWIPDLLVGIVLIACGGRMWAFCRGASTLMVATGFSWFAANVAADVLFLHRGFLVHALVTFPGWKPRSRREMGVVVGGYTAALVVPVWRNEPTAIVLACIFATVLLWTCAVAPTAHRLMRSGATLAGGVFAGAIVAGAVARTFGGGGTITTSAHVVYQVALGAVALILAATAVRDHSPTVTDLVVELGDSRSGTLRDALASTLGDPTLEVGYWDQHTAYVDAEGRALVLPKGSSTRSVTFVERDAQPFAALVHDAASLAEPSIIRAVKAATRLTTAHGQLQLVVRDQLTELSASRRRLVAAADEERRRLDDRLRAGAEQCLREIDALLGPRSIDPSEEPVRVRRAKELLAQTIEDLRQLASGLHPRELEAGLRAALAALAARSPLDVRLTVAPGGDVSGDVATAIFYVCAEALTNSAKHARATTATISLVTGEEGLTLLVADDGAGGAVITNGSGLRGLVDRVEALGGTLHVDSSPARGTCLTVRFPPTDLRPATITTRRECESATMPAGPRIPTFELIGSSKGDRDEIA